MTAPPGRAGLMGAALTVLGGALVVAVAAVLLNALAYHGPLVRATSTTATVAGRSEPTYSLNLATYPDSMAGEHGANGGAHPDWVSYGPSTNLWVPAHALVTVTIRNYDGASTLISPYFSDVTGTVGNLAYVNGKPVHHIDPAKVSHTFTIHMIPMPGQPTVNVSVPVFAVPDNAPNQANGYPKPEVTTFQFRTGASGRYIWQCNDPCGSRFNGFGGPMATLGYMEGTLTVGSGSAS